MKKLFLFIALSFFAFGQMWAKDYYTYESGQTIYVDFSNVSGGVNYPKTSSTSLDYDANGGGSIKAITLSANVTWDTDKTFIKTNTGNWADLKFSVPGSGRNCAVVAANGKSYSWSFYPADAPYVYFTNLLYSVNYGQTINFDAASGNITNPSYLYYVKLDNGDYSTAVENYTFNAAGTYTVKVVAKANGSGDPVAQLEQKVQCEKYSLMQNDHSANNKGSEVAICSTSNGTIYVAEWNCTAEGTYYFYVTKDTDPNAHSNCDFLKSGKSLPDGEEQSTELRSSSSGKYNYSYTLNATRTGVYTFTLNVSTNKFKCDFPPLTTPSVEFSGLSSSLVQGQNVVFSATSQNVEDPAYTFYVKQGEGEYGSAVSNYTFAEAGSYTVKVEVRANGTGDALAYAEQSITVQEGYYFTAGTTIYIDFTNVSGGVNLPYNDHQGYDYDANGGGTIKTITFTADVIWLTSQTFIKTQTGGWQSRKFIVPAAGQNYITVPADGSSFVWSTYDPNGPSVAFDALPDAVAQGTEVTFAATSEHVTNPAYTFYVKKGEGEYGSAVTSYTFNEGGTYTVKVEVREQGASGDALAYAEQNIGCIGSYTVYFRNTVNWGSVWIHLYTDDKTFGNNGVGWKKASVNEQMTLVDNTTDYYEYTYQAANPYTKVCFTRDENNNYDNFHNNQCSWSDSGYDPANNKLLWTPDNSTSTTINSCDYFNTGTWTAFAPGQPNVSFVGLSSTIAKGTNVAFEAEALNVTNPTYRFYVKPEGGEYGDAVTSYNFDTEGNFTVKVEVRSNDTGDALAYAEQDVTCALIYTVYFKNTMNWENVYVHFYSDDQTFGNNGVGGQDALLQAQMEQVGTSNIYTYSYTSDVAYTKVCFTLKEQYGYGQFHNNECSWSDAGLNYDTHEVLWIPNGVISHNINSCPYYDGKWFVYPSNDASVAFISLPAEVENGQSINLANYVVSMNVTSPAYTFYIKQGNDDYAAIASPYTFTASGTYMLKVEVRENGETDLLAYDEAEVTVPLIPTEFFLAGSFNSWSPTANCFRKASENAEEATTKITINEYSNITFKVVESGNWIGAEDQAVDKDHTSFTLGTESLNNIRLIPYAAGDYIFTLNLNTRLLTVTYPDGDPMPIPVNLYASGQFNNWAESSSTYKFTAVGDIATLMLQNLEANHDYEFKLIYNEAWLGANYTIKYHYNWEIPFSENTSENAVLKTFKAGDYILSYQISSGLLTVTYPTDGLETKQVEILTQADGYATFYSNKGWDYPAEVEAFYVSDVTSSGNLTMVPLLGYIPAWVPVILHANPDTYTFYECDDETWIDGNMLKGTIDNQVINNEHTHYIMTLSGGVPGLYWPFGTNAGIGEFENQAGKAYLEVPVTTPISGNVIARRGFPFIPQSDMPTSVESVKQKVESGKFLREGNLFIIREGRIFNAQGARIR